LAITEIFLNNIGLKRRTVQSQAEFSLFSLDEALLSSTVNNTFRNCRVRDSLKNEVPDAEA